MPSSTNPTLADLATLAAEVQRLDAMADDAPWIVNRFDEDGGCIAYQVQSEATGAVLGQVDETETMAARHCAELIAAYRTACPALAAFTSAIAPALAEWVAAHRACDAAGEAFDSYAAREQWSVAKRRLAAADRALRAAAAGMVAVPAVTRN